jgi:hypothetical protein
MCLSIICFHFAFVLSLDPAICDFNCILSSPVYVLSFLAIRTLYYICFMCVYRMLIEQELYQYV